MYNSAQLLSSVFWHIQWDSIVKRARRSTVNYIISCVSFSAKAELHSFHEEVCIYMDYNLLTVGLTYLVYDGYFLLLAQVFVYHVHFWRTYHCFSEWNNRLGCADLNFSKPLQRQVENLLLIPITYNGDLHC